jgi:putative hydrolase of the HAD superfamily
MGKDYLQYIERFLGNTHHMSPMPTAMVADFRPDPSIKAVIFDIYGTLLISGSGDIEESEVTPENINIALECGGMKLMDHYANRQDILNKMLVSFKHEVFRHHETARNADHPFPEIDILKIWDKILSSQQENNILFSNGKGCLECFTFVFEVLSNPISPMPGMSDVIQMLKRKGLPLGIISNAQFYTPVIMNYYLHHALSDAESIPPFDSDLTVFSYKLMRAKPDMQLFEIVKTAIQEKYAIQPSQVLFVGNDMFRDIYPATNAGFKTALFAGDERSLRLRTDKTEVNKLYPDFVITDLQQILNIIT